MTTTIPSPDETPRPNYADLIDAMTSSRPTWRHQMCLDRQLVAKVRQAHDRLEQAIHDKETAEAAGGTVRRKLGHVSPVDQARQALDAAKAERDASSVVFVLSPPTAEEEWLALRAAGAGDEMPAWQMWRITLTAGWRRTETVDGERLDFLDRDRYARALAALSTPELIGAHSHLMSIATDPDFS